jgi:hypothetical protein
LHGSRPLCPATPGSSRNAGQLQAPHRLPRALRQCKLLRRPAGLRRNKILRRRSKRPRRRHHRQCSGFSTIRASKIRRAAPRNFRSVEPTSPTTPWSRSTRFSNRIQASAKWSLPSPSKGKGSTEPSFLPGHGSALSQMQTARNNPAGQFLRFDICRPDNARPRSCISPHRWSRALPIVASLPRGPGLYGGLPRAQGPIRLNSLHDFVGVKRLLVRQFGRACSEIMDLLWQQIIRLDSDKMTTPH